MQKFHGLTEAQKAAKVQKYRLRLTSHAGDDIIYSDEKLFLLQKTHSQQKDQIYSVLFRVIPRN
jgi:hypothetical protein